MYYTYYRANLYHIILPELLQAVEGHALLAHGEAAAQLAALRRLEVEAAPIIQCILYVINK